MASPAPQLAPANGPSAPAPSSNESLLRHSTRTRRPPTRLNLDPTRLSYNGNQQHGYLAATSYDPNYFSFVPNAFLSVVTSVTASVNTLASTLTSAFVSITNTDPDLLSFDQAMREPNERELWQAAAKKEIDALVAKRCWVEVPKFEATTKILPGTWVFRRKRTPDGEISKYKARYCVRGDLEEGERDTFSPVVAWSTVRFFLIFSLLYSWTTCSVDFDNAFVQSTLDYAVWIHLPRGFNSSLGPNTCLRLLKSLYGLAISPRMFYLTLTAALLREGFKQSAIDPCLFYKLGFLIVLYVDDAGLAARNADDIDELINRLRKRGFELQREKTFSEYLGIKFEHNAQSGTITMTQKGLINKIIASTGMESCNPNWVLAARLALGTDPDGEPMTKSWSYPSIVGMLLYLATNTRPNIAFAVSQVARFNHSPRKSHATALKTIVRYLHRTRDKGMILRPIEAFRLDCYVDADFAGLYRRDPDASPTSVKSRAGFLILLANCPLIWRSQLIHEIALSTQEAEYSALSMSMRTLIPLCSLIVQIMGALRLPNDIRATFQCRAFEDNQGALTLATTHQITNHTKYYLVKWHWFWAHVQGSNGHVTILKVASADQLADFLTKGLAREVFEHL